MMDTQKKIQEMYRDSYKKKRRTPLLRMTSPLMRLGTDPGC
jgi:hypothetical protein